MGSSKKLKVAKPQLTEVNQTIGWKLVGKATTFVTKDGKIVKQGSFYQDQSTFMDFLDRAMAAVKTASVAGCCDYESPIFKEYELHMKAEAWRIPVAISDGESLPDGWLEDDGMSTEPVLVASDVIWRSRRHPDENAKYTELFRTQAVEAPIHAPAPSPGM